MWHTNSFFKINFIDCYDLFWAMNVRCRHWWHHSTICIHQVYSLEKGKNTQPRLVRRRVFSKAIAPDKWLITGTWTAKSGWTPLHYTEALASDAPFLHLLIFTVYLLLTAPSHPSLPLTTASQFAWLSSLFGYRFQCVNHSSLLLSEHYNHILILFLEKPFSK